MNQQEKITLNPYNPVVRHHLGMTLFVQFYYDLYFELMTEFVFDWLLEQVGVMSVLACFDSATRMVPAFYHYCYEVLFSSGFEMTEPPVFDLNL